jgi:glycosyltransferase involved in cell wall biosynthesis
MRNNKAISLVIPTKNEEGNLQRVLSTIPDFIDEILVVDGYSKDKTVEIAKKNKCRVLFDRGGKGSAVKIGVKKARGEYVIMMDADCSNRAVEFGMLLEGLEAGYDFCFGSRFIQGGGSDDMPFYRVLGNKFFVMVVNLIWGMKYSDLCYGYRSFRKQAFESLNLRSTDFSIETEMSIQVAKRRMRVVEIPSFEKARHSGKGNLRTLKDGWRITKRILAEIFRK